MSNNHEIAALGYIVVTAEDLDAWRQFAETILGLQVVASGSEGLYLRSDERAWRFGVEPGSDGGLSALGFEVPDRENLDALGSRLADAGVAVEENSDLAQQRRVRGLVSAKDPSGLPIEFYYGASSDASAFVSPTGARFITGDEGVGHCVILVDDADATYDFYVGLLGFHVRDLMTLGPMELTFTSPSPRHHSVAFAKSPGPAGIQHVMFQVDDIDVVGCALDRVFDDNIPLLMGIGRHTNDHMLSFYCESPSGLAIEYGWGGRRVDPEGHTTGSYDEASSWGHRAPNGLTIAQNAEAAAAEAAGH